MEDAGIGESIRGHDGLRVIMAGPLPPRIGGMATVIDDISHSSLPQRIELVLFDTGKKTPENRPIWQGVVSQLRLCKQWWGVLGGRKRNLVHIHTCSGMTYYLAGILLMLARLRNVPVILHIHGAMFDDFLDSLPLVTLFFTRWLARQASRVVVLSDSWKKILAERLPGARLMVIENGIPIAAKPIDLSGEKREVILFFLGNLSERKGIWELLEAMQQLPDTAHLVLAGAEDEPGIGARLNDEIAHKHLTGKVQWLGPVAGKEKQTWLEKADIFVLPSHAEGVPISLLEAMGVGLPVVATQVGGIADVIENGEQGLLVSPGDRKSLVAALRRLIKDQGLRIHLGYAAWQRCTMYYGIERVAGQYLELYRDIAVL
jgi:glycosyltransferase involved in cell wall biosynthesis